MYTKLGNVAQVFAGYAFRGAIKPDPSGTMYVFQAKDLTQGVPFVQVDSLTKVSQNLSDDATYLQKHDILLVARGMLSGSFRSTVFMSDNPRVIASSSVHVIRVNSARAIPEYVSMYLNTPQGQKAISNIVSGSYIGAIPRHALASAVDIPIPPIEKQKILVNLSRNILYQKELFSQRNSLNTQIVNALFNNFSNL